MLVGQLGRFRYDYGRGQTPVRSQRYFESWTVRVRREVAMQPEAAIESNGSNLAEPARNPGLAVDYRKFLDCVHCGLCTSSCPTYAELGDENDGPRGRIHLMRAVTDKRL